MSSLGQGTSFGQKLQADDGQVGSRAGLAEGFRYFGPIDLTRPFRLLGPIPTVGRGPLLEYFSLQRVVGGYKIYISKFLNLFN